MRARGECDLCLAIIPPSVVIVYPHYGRFPASPSPSPSPILSKRFDGFVICE